MPPLWVFLALVALFAAACLYAYLTYAQCDDTYIYLVYAKNWLNGNGLTFNGERVQGFTSLLWMMLILLAGKLPLSLPVVANTLSVVSGLLALVATYVLGRRLGLSPTRAIVPPAVLAGTADFAFYMSNGLESVFFSAMVLLAVHMALAPDPRAMLRSIRLPVLLMLVVFARPEGSMIAVLVIASLAWRSRHVPSVLRAGVSLAVLVAPVVIAVHSYYGDWLPNTYYAKAGTGLGNVGKGLRYLFAYTESSVVVVFLLLYVAALRIRDLGIAAFLLVVVGGWFAYVAYVGGDNMVGYRAVLPVIPVVYVLIVYALRHVSWRAIAVTALFAVVFNLYTWNFGSAWVPNWDVSVKGLADEWRISYPIRVSIGKQLKQELKPGSLVALNAAGIIPFHSELPTLDMLGLNNRYIARNGKRDASMPFGHQVGDGRYVMDRRPAAIIFGGQGSQVGGRFISDREIWKTSDFRRYYERRTLAHGNVAYYRRDVPLGSRSRQ